MIGRTCHSPVPDAFCIRRCRPSASITSAPPLLPHAFTQSRDQRHGWHAARGLSGRGGALISGGGRRPQLFPKSAGAGVQAPPQPPTHRAADAGRARLRVGPDLAGDAHRARRDSGVQHARRDARARRGRAVLSSAGCRDARFAPAEWKNCAHLAVSGILNVLSFSLFSVIAMMFAATGRVAMLVLHDADLGRGVRLARARRTIHRARASSRSSCASPEWRS